MICVGLLLGMDKRTSGSKVVIRCYLERIDLDLRKRSRIVRILTSLQFKRLGQRLLLPIPFRKPRERSGSTLPPVQWSIYKLLLSPLQVKLNVTLILFRTKLMLSFNCFSSCRCDYHPSDNNNRFRWTSSDFHRNLHNKSPSCDREPRVIAKRQDRSRGWPRTWYTLDVIDTPWCRFCSEALPNTGSDCF